MSTEKIFLEHKRRFLISAIIKSAVCGISFGLLVVGVVLLSLKLNAISINTWYYVLMGIGGALICGALVFLIFMPTDKYVAKRLDNEYDLDERVQTSLEYRQENAMLVIMQRCDAGEKMRNIPRSKFRLSKVWQYCVIAVLALALSFTAFFIPARQALGDEGPGFNDVDETPYSLTPFQETAMNELIKNVRESELEDGLKESTVSELANLLENLRLATNRGKMRNSVNYAVYYVNAHIRSANSNEQISVALRESVSYLPDAIDDGIVTHKPIQLLDYNNVKYFYTNMIGLVTNAVTPYLLDLFTTLSDSEAGLPAAINELAKSIHSALNSSDVKDSDELYVALDNFATKLTQTASQPSDKIDQEIESLYKVFSEELTDAISVQAYNLAMNRFIRNRLLIVFGMYESDPDYVPESPSGTPDDVEDPPDDGKGPAEGGGELEGDIQYGSKDKVYNPLTGEYVPYGQLLQWYYEEFGKLVESGTLSPDQVHAAKVYFDLLFNGFDD